MVQFSLIIQGQATPGSHLTTVIATDPDEEREGLRYSIRGQVKAPKQVIQNSDHVFEMLHGCIPQNSLHFEDTTLLFHSAEFCTKNVKRLMKLCASI